MSDAVKENTVNFLPTTLYVRKRKVLNQTDKERRFGSKKRLSPEKKQKLVEEAVPETSSVESSPVVEQIEHELQEANRQAEQEAQRIQLELEQEKARLAAQEERERQEKEAERLRRLEEEAEAQRLIEEEERERLAEAERERAEWIQEMERKALEEQRELDQKEAERLAAEAKAEAELAALEAARLAQEEEEAEAALAVVEDAMDLDDPYVEQVQAQKKDQLIGLLKMETNLLRQKLAAAHKALQAKPKQLAPTVDPSVLADLKSVQQRLDQSQAQLSQLEKGRDAAEANARTARAAETRLGEELAQLRAKYEAEVKTRKDIFNQLQELRGNIRVAIRIRPGTGESQLKVEGEGLISVPSRRQPFEFEQVYSAQHNQQAVYQDAWPLITSLLDGYNVCIMAYGQTGSGKTHTMQGTPTDPGIIPRALSDLFQAARSDPATQYRIELSILEVYNEEIRDLLAPGEGKKHEVREDGSGAIEITNLSRHAVTCIQDVNKFTDQAAKNRAQACTNVNEHSSRSHAVVTLFVEGYNRETKERIVTKLSLVDLAGSENVGMSGVTGDALVEARHINRSLAALSDVLSALAENRSHIPYRNSVVTRLLQDSLGGDAKMLLLVTVAPEAAYTQQSIHALGFGSRARQIVRGEATRHKSKA